MQITVKLFATLRTGRFSQELRSYPDGASCRQVAVDIGIPLEDLGIVLLNGRHASLGQVLRDGDCLSLFPLLGGG